MSIDKEIAYHKRKTALLTAQRDLPGLKDDIAQQEEPGRGYDRRVLTLAIEDVNESGSISESSVEIDIASAPSVLDAITITLRRELEALDDEGPHKSSP